MGKGTDMRGRDWLIQVAVAIGYALTYLAIHPYSDAHWSLTSGFRLACLLLIPYRYWFALAIGEVVPLTYFMLQCLPQFGYATVAIWSFPPLAVAMPVVWYCRRHLGLFPAERAIDMKTLLICALGTSLIWTAVTYLGLYVEAEPQRTLDNVNPIMIAGLFVGDYVAILTVVTWPLLWKITRSGRPWKVVLSDAIASPLTSDMLIIALPALLVIAIGSAYMGDASRGILQMSLFLPVAWLALKYGWRGAAACGPVAVACICVLTQSVPDAVIIQTQAFVAFAVTCLFLMGARIAAQLYVEERERHAAQNALRVAQQCLYQAEMRLRHTSHSLEMVGGSVSITQGRMVERVRHFLPDEEKQRLTRQVSATQTQLYRLAESIHPVAWRERGLPAALREAIGRVLEEAGIGYVCDIQGRGLSQLAPAVHQTIYRLASEGVAHVCMKQICMKQTCHHVRLILRGGQRSDGRRLAVLRIMGTGDNLNLKNLTDLSGEGPSISAKLGTYGMDITALRAQVALFDGALHVKEKNGVITLTMLLYDVQHLSPGHTVDSRSSQLWVR